MSSNTRPLGGAIASLRKMRKIERLALIKDRYRQLILEPRQRIEMELDEDFADDYLNEEADGQVDSVYADVREDDDEI